MSIANGLIVDSGPVGILVLFGFGQGSYLIMAGTKIPFRERQPLLDQSHSLRVHYLGWSGPILHSACDFLQKKYTRGNKWDMDQCLLVLPGGFAGRLLMQLIATRASEQSLILRPPELLTIGSLPEKLYSATGGNRCFVFYFWFHYLG